MTRILRQVMSEGKLVHAWGGGEGGCREIG